jgi:hypothetical protein
MATRLPDETSHNPMESKMKSMLFAITALALLTGSASAEDMMPFFQFVQGTLDTLSADAQKEILATISKRGGFPDGVSGLLASCKANYFDHDRYPQARTCVRNALSTMVW